ncbi:MAG: polyprenyl synthetase family protein [Candidatus Azobacteroides sp.]|nr:polyprenyl synthetase family protein [Candidatus Azobacteroides sp.]
MMTLSDALIIINKEIQSIEYPKNPAGLYSPIAYLLTLKGKKIRPALTLLACNLFCNEVKEAIPTALAWEIFHNFTLMHDDVMDKADLRRGQATVHKKWNENTAILSGDTMLILSYKYLAKSPSRCLEILLDLFSDTAAKICEGQQFDMEYEKRTMISEKEYIEMIRLKTAVMMGACLKSGAIVGGANESDQQNLYDFGIRLGIAFQIKDDWLDVYGDSNTFGKKTGGDILCNKKTFLLVTALETATGKDKEALLYWLNNNIQSDEKIEAVRQLYDKLSVKEKTQKALQNYHQQSINALQKVSADPAGKKILADIAGGLVEREF